jgi:phosphatidylinositol-3-phosphatase
MRKLGGVAALAVLFGIFNSCGGVTGTAGNSGGNGGGGTTSPEHIVIVVLENKAYSDVIGSPSMPYLNSLAQQYSLATNYFANIHPSLANYFVLTVGDVVTSGGDGFSGVVTLDNVVHELAAAGKTWKSYAQNLPADVLSTGTPPYARNHNPFTYFQEVRDNPVQLQNLVPITQLATDLANNSLPDYVFIVPDNQNNSHDCPAGMAKCTLPDTLKAADSFLATYVDPVLKSSSFQQNGVLVVTWDESGTEDTAHAGGHVVTVIAGPKVKRGYQSIALYQHESVLRMALKRLGITTYPNGAASAPDMDEFFQ